MSDNKNLDAMTSEFKRRKAEAEARKARRQRLWGEFKDTVAGWFERNPYELAEERTPTWGEGVANVQSQYNSQATRRTPAGQADPNRPARGAQGEGRPVNGNQIPGPTPGTGFWGNQPAARETPTIQKSRLPEDRSPAGLWGNRLSEAEPEKNFDWVNDWNTGRSLEESSQLDREVQNFLKASGYDIEVDGYFGNQSMNALNRWLNKNGFDGFTDEAKAELARQMEEKFNRLSGGQR